MSRTPQEARPGGNGDAASFEGWGRFAHEPEPRRVTVRWLPDRKALSIADGERSMLPATRLEDLVVATDGSGRYAIQRHRGSAKPIEFTPDHAAAFDLVAPSVYSADLSIDDSWVAPPAAQEPAPRDLRYVGTTLTRWAAGLTFAAAALFGLAAFLYFSAGEDYTDYLVNPPPIDEDLSMAEAADAVWGFGWIVTLAAAVVFLVWFNRSYKAAASRGPLRTRWSSGWAVGGWFIPFANLVIPKLVMNEVDRTSNPINGDPPIGVEWRNRPRLVTSDLWWAAWILASVAAGAESYMLNVDPDGVLLFAVAGASLLAAAGGLLGSVVLTVGARLAEPRTRAWEGL